VTPARAAALAGALPSFVTPVLLLVNATPAEISAAVDAVPHALLQFHGDETPAQCEAAGRAYLRAARMGEGLDLLDFAHRYVSAGPLLKALLLDTHVDGYGGSGKVFDWSRVPASVPCPIVLSGGLNPANVIDGVLRVRPFAVDVSSGVEVAKGIKDAALMRRFCDAVRAADDRLGAT
jgi:phosphoribosylanthranilate isomerase